MKKILPVVLLLSFCNTLLAQDTMLLYPESGSQFSQPVANTEVPHELDKNGERLRISRVSVPSLFGFTCSDAA